MEAKTMIVHAISTYVNRDSGGGSNDGRTIDGDDDDDF